MPIRKEMLARYPKDWPEISRRIRERDGNKCKWCGIDNYALGGRLKNGDWLSALPKEEKLMGLEWPKPGEWWWCGNGETEGRARLRIVRIVLTVAHIHDHAPENCDDANLAALCQRCHNRHDMAHRVEGRKQRERLKLAIGDLLP